MKYVVTVNGEKYEVEVERANRVGRSTGTSLTRGPVERTETQAPVAPAPVQEKVAAPAAPKAAPVAAPTGSGDSNVVSPMPGTILDIKVSVGDKISEGDVVVILEAMKMENEITSEFTGTVAAIKVKKGDTVDTDAVLIEIK